LAKIKETLALLSARYFMALNQRLRQGNIQGRQGKYWYVG
jgi:hypothetical protein